jgi:hypothetical protein
MPEHTIRSMSSSEFYDLTENSGGICRNCGETTEGGCEPDARNYQCESCGEREVFGVEEALISGWVEIEGDDDYDD